MLEVLISFIVILIISYSIGALLLGICDKQNKSCHQVDNYVMAGILGLTVYAQFFSLFYKVGLWALIGALALTVFSVCLNRGWMFGCLKKINRNYMLVYIILFCLFSYGSSRGYIHYDTSLYHAQAIRWIEEYGVVKGLGNLHTRLAYNSAAFPLTALFSFSFIKGKSLHIVSGFLAYVLACKTIPFFEIFGKRKFKPADSVRLISIIYLLMIFDEMVSPASDYFCVLTVLYLVISLLELIQNREEAGDFLSAYANLCVYGVFVVTIKLSGVMVLLLALYPAYFFIREKRIKDIVANIFKGLVVAFPYFARNVIISGYLLYPSTAFDFFDFKWKLPKDIADYDRREISVWGRGYSDVSQYDKPFREWFADWVSNLSASNKGMLCLCVLCGVALLVGIFYTLKYKKVGFYAYIFVDCCMGLCLLFWLLSAPLIRYGWVFLWCFPALVLGQIVAVLVENEGRKRLGTLLAIVLLLFLAYKAYAFGKELVRGFVNDYWICQKIYDEFEVEAYEIEGVTFYCAQNTDQTGYSAFPSSPVKASIGFLGNDLKDGFYYKK